MEDGFRHALDSVVSAFLPESEFARDDAAKPVDGSSSDSPQQPAKEPWQMSRKQFESNYMQHSIIRPEAKPEEVEHGIRQDGFSRGIGPNVMRPTAGNPTDIMQRNYGTKAGVPVISVPSLHTQQGGNGARIKQGWKFEGGHIGVPEKDYEPLHRIVVRTALAAGKPVPPSVLAEHPDLAAESEFARKPAAGQKGFNFDEDSHPRESAAHDGKRPGEFAPKGHIDTEAMDEPATARKWYGMSNRPPAPGAIPKGNYEHEAHPDFRHGKISYDQPLTEKEQADYELTPIHEDADIPEIAKKAGAAMGEYASQYADPENDHLLNDVLGQSRMRPLLGHVDKDKLKAEIRRQFGSKESADTSPPPVASGKKTDPFRIERDAVSLMTRQEAESALKPVQTGPKVTKFYFDIGVGDPHKNSTRYPSKEVAMRDYESMTRADDTGESPKEHEVWHQGDRVRMTGKTSKIAGGTFHEAEILEGYKKGQMVQVRDKGEKYAEIAGKQDEWKDQQAGFAKLRQNQQRSDNDKGILESRAKIKSLANQAEQKFASGDHRGADLLMENADKVEKGLDNRKTASLAMDNGKFHEYTSHGINKPDGKIEPFKPLHAKQEKAESRPATFRWLGAYLSGLDGGSKEASKHWTEKARKVIKADPKSPQELADALVNFAHMKGGHLTAREVASHQAVLDLMKGRHFVDELPAKSDEPKSPQPLPKQKQAAAAEMYPSLAGHDKKDEESSEWSPENHLKIAADSIDKLRGQDIHRLLDSAPPARMQQMASYIRKHRPEFSSDIHDAQLDIENDRGEATKEPESSQPMSFGERFSKHMASGKNDHNAMIHSLAEYLQDKGSSVTKDEINGNWHNHHVGSLNKNSTDEQIKAALEASVSDKPTHDMWWMDQKPNGGPNSSAVLQDKNLANRRKELFDHADHLERQANVMKAIGSDKAEKLSSAAKGVRDKIAANINLYKQAVAQEEQVKKDAEAAALEQKKWKPDPTPAKAMTEKAMGKAAGPRYHDAFAKMLATTGWYSDGRMAMKPPEKMKQKIISAYGDYDKEARVPDLMKSLTEQAEKRSGEAMKIAGTRTTPADKNDPESHTILMADSKDRHHILDAKMVQTFRKAFPKATFHPTVDEDGKHGSLVSVKNGNEVVGFLMDKEERGDHAKLTSEHVAKMRDSGGMHEFSRPEGQGKIWSGVSMDAANSTNAAHAASKAAGGEGHRLSSIIHKQVGSSMLAGDPSAKSHRSAANNHELVASEHEKAASIGDSPQKHAVAAELHRQASKTHREAEVSLAPKTFSRPDGACRSMLVAAVHKALNHDGNYTKDSTVEEIPENPSDLDEHVAAVLSELAKHSPEVKQALESYLAC